MEYSNLIFENSMVLSPRNSYHFGDCHSFAPWCGKGIVSTATTAERFTYCPFGTGKVLIVKVTDGEVAKISSGSITGRLREAGIYQEGGENLTNDFLQRNQFNSLDEIIAFWQNPLNSLELRGKLSDLLFGEGPEGFEFHFRRHPTNVETVMIIVCNSAGMSLARRRGLAPRCEAVTNANDLPVEEADIILAARARTISSQPADTSKIPVLTEVVETEADKRARTLGYGSPLTGHTIGDTLAHNCPPHDSRVSRGVGNFFVCIIRAI